jgi:uncharacterized protein
MTSTANALKNSSSPYLQQHAYNPVQWYPWGPEALQKAIDENKLLIISIGYSACHWCHVMEHESFENEEIATVMNKFFVSIKVDREERPDIDALYMEAVQMLSGQGGWPLNCITLPDQRPIYGGTYFPKEQWREVLLQLAQLWRDDPEKCTQYAARLTEGMRENAAALLQLPDDNSNINFDKIYEDWSVKFDWEDGGMLRAPKFPMPDNYRYLLAWAKLNKEEGAWKQVELTLKKMALGGINDQLGGGFARYSTDMQWKVPHFEKMLYDNAQLVVLYAEAWQYSKDPLFKETVEQTLEFVQRELTSADGGFYSALDADSEGVEGKFYVWTEKELREELKEDYDFFSSVYHIDKTGYWEHGNYILIRCDDLSLVKAKFLLSDHAFNEKLKQLKEKLMKFRSQRVRPGLDTKILCSWNALMIRGFAFAAAVFGNEDYRMIAKNRMDFLLKNLLKNDLLLHQVPGDDEAVIPAFLDDYAFTIEALISLYQLTFDENYIRKAQSLAAVVMHDFKHETLPFFYFTSVQGEKLLQRRIELQDNVTPSGNAVMAFNLYSLGLLAGNLAYSDFAKMMVDRMSDQIEKLCPWHSRWALEALLYEKGRNEVVFAGAGAGRMLLSWMQNYQPESLVAGAENSSDLSLLAGRFPEDDSTLIYVCRNRSCELPVTNVEEAINLVKQ